MKLIRKLSAVLGILLFFAVSVYAETIVPQETRSHVGTYATVEGLVSQVSKSSGGTTFINFGGRFPNHVFYAVIFRDSAHLFPGVSNLEGRVIAIQGTIELYRGKPQIILTSPEQIELR